MTSTLHARPTWYPPVPSSRERRLGGAAAALLGLGQPLYAGQLRRGLGTLFASPPAAPPPGGDEGWFGPDSIAWRVHADPSALVAGMAAFVVQTLHPRAMAGVYDHSDFTNDFFGRTRRTGHYVLGVTYGTSAEADRWVRTVKAVHKRVVGHTPDGRPYSAAEPRLLEWVHLTQYQALVSAYQRFGPQPLTPDELDRYVAETARVGEQLGVLAPPRTWAELDAAFQGFRAELAVGEQAATGLAALRSLPGLPAAARPLWTAVFTGATACLPRVARKLLLLPEPRLRDLVTCRALVSAIGRVQGPPQQLTQARARLEERVS